MLRYTWPVHLITLLGRLALPLKRILTRKKSEEVSPELKDTQLESDLIE